MLRRASNLMLQTILSPTVFSSKERGISYDICPPKLQSVNQVKGNIETDYRVAEISRQFDAHRKIEQLVHDPEMSTHFSPISRQQNKSKIHNIFSLKKFQHVLTH